MYPDIKTRLKMQAERIRLLEDLEAATRGGRLSVEKTVAEAYQIAPPVSRQSAIKALIDGLQSDIESNRKSLLEQMSGD